jgi:hypothetical protein
VEFKALAPTYLIKFFYPNFSTGKFFAEIGIKIMGDEGKESYYASYEAIIIISLLFLTTLLFLIIVAFILNSDFGKKQLQNIKKEMFWNGILQAFQINYMKIIYTNFIQD